jgi:plasmid stabilization system protein ParE
MTPEDAVALIIAEAREGDDSLITNVRAGQDPGPERMRQLIQALRTVFRSLARKAELDRHLAAALYTLGSDVPLTISSLASKGQAWRKEFMEQEIYELLIGVQGIFEDRWLDEPEPSETIH